MDELKLPEMPAPVDWVYSNGGSEQESTFTERQITACTTTPPADLPAELPHYPCTRQEGGKTVYFACSADEWLHQIITLKERP